MRFIDTLAADTTVKLLKASGMMWIIFGPDGRILDSSFQFERWIGYTHDELLRTTWAKLSVPDDNLDSDVEALRRLPAYEPFYMVRKQFIPKGERPQWGELYLARHPADSKDIEFCFGWWLPHKRDSDEALKQAQVDATERMSIIMRLHDEIQKITTQSEEDRFLLSTFRMIKKYPRLTAMAVMFAAGLFGVNNALEFLQRTGLADIPARASHDELRVYDTPAQFPDKRILVNLL